MQETQLQSMGEEVLWRRKWIPTSVFSPGEFYGQRSLVGYSPWGHKESDTTEQLTLSHFHKGETRVVIAQREKLPLWDSPWNCKESDTTEQLSTAHDVWSLGGEDPLEKELTTHLSILVRWILWAEESGSLQSMQLHRVGHPLSSVFNFVPLEGHQSKTLCWIKLTFDILWSVPFLIQTIF